MSQHNDILKFEIMAGIRDGLSSRRIVERVEGVLIAAEYSDDMIENVAMDCLNTANDMRRQKDGLYGVSCDQLDNFMNELTKQFNLNPVGFN